MRIRLAVLLLLTAFLTPALAKKAVTGSLQHGLVHLREIAPGIQQDIRLAGWHNVMGRPAKGYEAPECMVTIDAARALKAVEEELNASGLGLKVYDCYRPKRAVDDLAAWHKNQADQAAKAEFYPGLAKEELASQGYLTLKADPRSAGSSVDATLVIWPHRASESFSAGQDLRPCAAPYDTRFFDGSLDMGTGYGCMDERARPFAAQIPLVASHNRALLRAVMEKHGFMPSEDGWWRFTLKKEPFPGAVFDVPVTAVPFK